MELQSSFILLILDNMNTHECLMLLTHAWKVDYWVERPVIRDTWEYKVDEKLIKHYEFYAFCKT